MTKRHLVIATRESPLAMRQANIVKELLIQAHPGLSVDLLGMTTEGDQKLSVALRTIGGKGLFVKELEQALLDGRADIAVHSMKDVPMVLPPDLILPVIGKREDVRDALVANHYHSIAELPRNAVVGTASLRRQLQLKALRPDLILKDVRGNLQTRLQKLDNGGYDALILASAGLKRLGLANRIKAYLSIQESLPSAGQGALGIECRQGDEAVLDLIQVLNDAKTAAEVTAERALCRRLDGGCQVPMAAYAHLHHEELHLQAWLANTKGSRELRAQAKANNQDQAQALGLMVAEMLLEKGAAQLLKE